MPPRRIWGRSPRLSQARSRQAAHQFGSESTLQFGSELARQHGIDLAPQFGSEPAPTPQETPEDQQKANLNVSDPLRDYLTPKRPSRSAARAEQAEALWSFRYRSRP